jgi:hypothetical protein
MPEPESGQSRHAAMMATLSAGLAVVMHAFVFALLLVVVLLVVRVGVSYDEMELPLREGVAFVLMLATTVQRWWFLLLLPMFVDVGLVFWLAAKPSRRWMLPLWNYLWLGGALTITTLAFAVMVSPLFRIMVNPQ